MKTIIIILISLVSFSGISQTPYQKGMQKALDLWSAKKPTEAINLFERIAKAEPNQWLPSFYVSYILVIEGFSEKDEAKLKSQMDKAMLFMNDAKAISKDEVEIMLLDALWYTVWVAHDGAVYGMKYGAKVSGIYQEAITKAPNNPRVILNKAEWDIGGAKFFGKPTEPFCKEIERAIELFNSFTPEAEFYPQGGKERAQNLIKENCSK
ncbi:MAG: hypothetical protein QM499_09970 [Flavobacteriaceae bacterium]